MSNIKLANSIFSRALSAARGRALPALGTGASMAGVGYGTGKLVGGVIQ